MPLCNAGLLAKQLRAMMQACILFLMFRYMCLSIDEAATHVGNKRFRLVAMVFEQNGQDLIGTACSQPIRVVANNDVPTGAAHIRLSCTIRYIEAFADVPSVLLNCLIEQQCFCALLSCCEWLPLGHSFMPVCKPACSVMRRGRADACQL